MRLRLRCRLRLRKRFGVDHVVEVAVGGWRLRLQFGLRMKLGLRLIVRLGLRFGGGGVCVV